MIPKPITDRFWKQVSLGNHCWHWMGHINQRGYGQFRPSRKGITERGAHRFSWMVNYGEIPTGMQVCHHCDNPSCVNPAHLFLGSAKDNTADMLSKGRDNIHIGVENGRAKLNRSQVMEVRRLALETELTYEQIGKQFNLKPSSIGLVVRRRRYASIQ